VIFGPTEIIIIEINKITKATILCRCVNFDKISDIYLNIQ